MFGEGWLPVDDAVIHILVIFNKRHGQASSFQRGGRQEPSIKRQPAYPALQSSPVICRYGGTDSRLTWRMLLGASVLSAQRHLRDIEYLDPLLRDVEDRQRAPRVAGIYRTDGFAEHQPPLCSV